MFGDYDDVDAYEDELYREASSSEESVDSEVECYLYSQVHYAQDLSLVDGQEEGGEKEADEQDSKDKSGLKLDPGKKPKQRKRLINLSDTDCIQISDSPEVITLSDTTEEESVYTCKGKKKSVTSCSGKGRPSNPTGHSTPKYANPQTHDCSVLDIMRPKKGDHSKHTTSGKSPLIHEVLVIEESSEEEGECSSEEGKTTSDSGQSDDLESWMLLDTTKEDGDTSIQLNLEGCGTSVREEEEKGVDWSIGDKDVEAQIGNFTPFKRMNNRYYTSDKNMICRNCDKRGHLSKNCSVPRKLPACCLCGVRGHLQNSCPARLCSNCFMPGHFSKECIEKAYWKKNCHRCSMTGHFADACPEIWRQYHLTIKPGPIKKPTSNSRQKGVVYCCNCSREGHCGYECEERRMFHGNFPACPFICSYDRDHDIWKRNQRVESKVQELQEAGLLPMAIKQPRWENEDRNHPSKRRKKHLDRELKKGHKEDQWHKEGKKIWNERNSEKKHKTQYVPWSDGMEEDFPRGTPYHSLEPSACFPIKNYNPSLFQHANRAQEGSGPLEVGKKKKRKKHKGRRDHSLAADESLFSIKQRHKKSKKYFD